MFSRFRYGSLSITLALFASCCSPETGSVGEIRPSSLTIRQGEEAEIQFWATNYTRSGQQAARIVGRFNGDPNVYVHPSLRNASSNPAVATISDLVVRGVSPGQSTITVWFNDGGVISALAGIEVTVLRSDP